MLYSTKRPGERYAPRRPGLEEMARVLVAEHAKADETGMFPEAMSLPH
jgi:hypothetical protein